MQKNDSIPAAIKTALRPRVIFLLFFILFRVPISVYDLLSALSADKGENENSPVIVKLVFLITNYSCGITMLVITSFGRSY